MAGVRNYLEMVSGIEASFPRSESRIKRAGIKLFAVIAAVESKAWQAFPVVESPEVAWQPSTNEEIEIELREILNES